MKLKWEKNSRVMALAQDGKIEHDDIIARTQTDNFPAEAATVRLSNVRAKEPFVTVHIRGKAKQRTQYWNGRSYECAMTCRVNLGGPNTKTMNSNGDLDENLTWLDVHSIVTRVKQVMDI